MRGLGRRSPRQIPLSQFIQGVPDLPPHPVVGLHVASLRGKKPIDQTLPPVILLHGLFGSHRNWKSVGRDTAALTRRDVIGLDLRNHGNSPHAAPHDYNSMAKDVIEVLKANKWRKSIVVGHSMGAKVAMLVALYAPMLVAKLVVVDNSPVKAPLGEKFHRDLIGLCEIERDVPQLPLMKLKKHKNLVEWAYIKLREYEDSHMVRMFLLDNLMIQRPTQKHQHKIRMPVLNFLKDNVIEKMGDWPEEAAGLQFTKPVKVLKALDSNFILPEHMDAFHKHFPNMDYEERNTTHWLVSDDPKAFVKILVNFIDKAESCT